MKPPVKVTILFDRSLNFKTQGFGFSAEDANGTLYRQAVEIPIDATMEQFADALETLAAFVRAPDDRIRVNEEELTGHLLLTPGIRSGSMQNQNPHIILDKSGEHQRGDLLRREASEAARSGGLGGLAIKPEVR